VALRQNLVYSAFINRDYEGEIANAGDTVRITSIGRPSISNYVPNSTTITPEQVNDSQRTLVVDQAKYFAFAVDDVDARQAAGNVIPQALDEAAFNLSNVVDQYIASFYTSIQSANVLSSGSQITVSAATPTDAYDKVLVPLKVILDQANVPTQGRSVVVSPALHGCLLRDIRFVGNPASNTSSALASGSVGQAAGFNILVSNQAPADGSAGNWFIAGNNSAITFADQINKVEAYRPQSSFADAVKGLALYGAKVVRPDSLASADVKVTA